jgi:hypothetical protein
VLTVAASAEAILASASNRFGNEHE